MPKKRKQSRTAKPQPGFSPKPSRRERASGEGDPPPTHTIEPVTPGLLLKRRTKRGKKQLKRGKR